jgi:cell division protease FtsH
MVVPLEDKYSVTRNELLDQLTYAMGGRIAEELVFHDPTTGASNDIEKATKTARKMVTEYGMSNTVGAIKLGENEGESPYARSQGAPYSDTTAVVVDREVQGLLEQAQQEAWWVLTNNRDVLDRLAAELLDVETIGHERLAEIFAGIVKLPERAQWLSSPERPVSSRPPVPLKPHLPASGEEAPSSHATGAGEDAAGHGDGAGAPGAGAGQPGSGQPGGGHAPGGAGEPDGGAHPGGAPQPGFGGDKPGVTDVHPGLDRPEPGSGLDNPEGPTRPGAWS